MDPTATLRRIDEIKQGDWGGGREELEEYCEFLRDWLRRGGFGPDWSAYPDGAEYYRVWVEKYSLEIELEAESDLRRRGFPE